MVKRVVVGIEPGLQLDPQSLCFLKPEWALLRQVPLEHVLSQAQRLLPDGVILCAKSMAAQAVQVLGQLKQQPPYPAVYLVVPPQAAILAQALANGADGCYSLAEASGPAKAEGGVLLDAACRWALADGIMPFLQQNSPAVALNAVEEQILTLLAGGHNNPAIAAAVYLSVGTVRNYIAALQHKTGAQNRVELLLWAQKHGFIAQKHASNQPIRES